MEVVASVAVANVVVVRDVGVGVVDSVRERNKGIHSLVRSTTAPH